MHGITTTPKSERVFDEHVFEGAVVKCDARPYRLQFHNSPGFAVARIKNTIGSKPISFTQKNIIIGTLSIKSGIKCLFLGKNILI